MQLSCTINGQLGTIEIDRAELLSIAKQTKGAMTVTEAANYLGVCENTVRTHAALKNLDRTAYGTITIESLDRHLAEQGKARKK